MLNGRFGRCLTAVLGLFWLAMWVSAAGAQEEDLGWPREITVPQGTIVLYQPQPEKLEGNDLYVRAAVSVARTGETEPQFGAVWMTATLETDRDQRICKVVGLKVTQLRFPDLKPEEEQGLAGLLEREIPTWELVISLDRLLTSLEVAESGGLQSEDLSTTPPRKRNWRATTAGLAVVNARAARRPRTSTASPSRR